MTWIASNISKLREEIPQHVKIVAVSKTMPVSVIADAYRAGQKYFGENRVQELLGKKDSLPEDIEWHLIGHLQSNKVKYIVPFISMIQSVDSFKILNAINKEACGIGRIVDCLLQIHIAEEESKFGFKMEELMGPDKADVFGQLSFVRVCGVMGMATFTDDFAMVRKEFDYLKECYTKLREKYFAAASHFSVISMGMSGDYKVAIEAGSNMVRIGSLVFGERVSHKTE